MLTETKTIWGIHGGKTSDADSMFLKKNFVGLGWADVGDLKRLGDDRETFKAAVEKTYPQFKPGAIPVAAGQLYRFVHGLEVGDRIIYPSRRDRQIHIGEITGDYKYDPKLEPGYPHIRSVKWLKSVPRTHFSQGAL